MFKKLTLAAVAAFALTSGAAVASEGTGAYGHVEDHNFSFEGPLGRYDQQQLQRGLKVYTEVCAACHGLRYVALRALAEPGGPSYAEDEVRAFAAENFEVFDAELDDYRPSTPADHFPTVTGDGMGPDLSLMAKARAGFHGPYGTGINQLLRGIGGAEYIRAYLLGFTGEEDEVAGQYLYENMAFPTGWVQMPAGLLEDDAVEYDDGTPATAEQMAEDVAAFLMWSAEPKMMARKQTGTVAVVLMVLMSVLLYLTNKKLWYPIKHGGKHAKL